MISAFMIFSGVTALNCCGTNRAAPLSFSSICWELKAVPIRKSFLKVCLREGVFVVLVAFLVLLHANNVTKKIESKNEDRFIMNYQFLFLEIVSGGPR